MKKIFVLLLAVVVIISSVLISCSKKEEINQGDETSGIADGGNDIGFETVDMTDKNGNVLKDKNGNKLTSMVAVEYGTDKNGNNIAEELDENGNKTGVTHKLNGTTSPSGAPAHTIKAKRTTTTVPGATGTTNSNVAPTKSDETTANSGTDEVPKTSATGKEITFSIQDQEIISSMLEVPYLFTAGYENSDGVPISIATHTAVWMAEREGGSNLIYPSSPIVLNLFKFFGQTVVDFKTKCNSDNPTGAPIKYISKDDTFEISGYTPKKQTVIITKIEDVGGNNYYKVTGNVSNADGKTRVIAIIQKNRLESTLGFSVKALKWS